MPAIEANASAESSATRTRIRRLPGVIARLWVSSGLDLAQQGIVFLGVPSSCEALVQPAIFHVGFALRPVLHPHIPNQG